MRYKTVTWGFVLLVGVFLAVVFTGVAIQHIRLDTIEARIQEVSTSGPGHAR